MLVPASTSVSISRATQTDAYGDPVDIDNIPIATGVPAAIASRTVMAQNAATGTPRQVTVLSGVLPRGTDVQLEDRLTDEATGVVYNVDQVNPGTSYGFVADIVVTLSAAGG